MILFLIVIALLAIFLIFIYNSFIQLANKTNEAWSDISAQLKRRYDLIPNLVSVVQVYASHEKQVFQEVTDARVKALNASSTYDKGVADNGVRDALVKILAVAENYPELRASENFLKLQQELTDTENKIEAARRFYNGNVRNLNTQLEVFPNNLLAAILNFKKRDFFQLDQESANE
ncbi:MAG TPA: LemA family protein [Candidatus Saccharimonadales bacterium]|nr:LemA family protein [Candidatus Saccharimonadales bacterium]